MTADEALGAAWTYCAPGRIKDVEFPRGFWPDVARVAIEMFTQQTTNPRLDFRPTMCERGNAPEPVVRRKSSGINLDKLEINL